MDQGIKIVPISCNFSRLHAKDDFFPEKIQVIADMYNIPHHFLEIEITESIAMEKMEIVLRHFKKFKEMAITAFKNVMGAVVGLGSAIGASIVGGIKLAYNTIKDFGKEVTKLFKGLFDAMAMVGEGVVSLIKGIAPLKDALSKVLSKISIQQVHK